MNNKQALLPPGASRLARQAAEICAAAEAVNFDYSDLWNADKCPEALLPFLAWRYRSITRRKVGAKRKKEWQLKRRSPAIGDCCAQADY